MEEAKLVAASAIALAVTLFMIFWMRPLARKLGLVDRPGGRKVHRGRVPLIGGLCFFAGTLAGLAYLGVVDRFVASLFVPCVLMVATGAIDDLTSLSVRSRIVIQVATAVLVVAATGVYLDNAGQLFGESDLPLGLLGIPITIVAVIGLVNAFNMLDGIDGLAAGMAMVSIGAILLFAQGQYPLLGVLMLLQVLLAALVPYLCVNLGWPDGRKVFMGDAGSTLIGFVLAWSLVFLSHRRVAMLAPVDTLWCVALPVIDTLAVMQRRIRAGRSPFKPDRQHLHHLLLDAGCPPRQALVLILLAASVFAAIGYGLRNAPEIVSLTIFFGLMGLYMLRLPQLLQWLAKAIKRAHAEAVVLDVRHVEPIAATLASEPRSNAIRALCVLGGASDAAQMAPIAQRLADDDRFETRICLATPARRAPTEVLKLFGIHPDVEVPVERRGMSMAEVTSATLDRLHRVIEDFRPDVVLVPADATPTVAATLAASYRKIPVASVEPSGRLRRLDATSRKVAGSLATWHFAASDKAGRSLQADGVPAERILVTGDPAHRTLQAALEALVSDESRRRHMEERFDTLRQGHPLLLVSCNERMGERLEPLARALRRLSMRRSDLDIVCLVEPSRSTDGIDGSLSALPNVHVVPRGDFLATAWLLDAATLVLAASEDAAAEASRAGKPLLVLNREGEPRACDAMPLRHVDVHEHAIFDVVLSVLNDRKAGELLRPAPQDPVDACARIAESLAALRPATTAEPISLPAELPLEAGLERLREIS
jgi:undecaprenyl-phosphate alpha-N-acetylglucosaminyl 1-phosphatetransferase/UDP-N-acetylglucosamine 2-epimerase